jgi:F0F1-type ATP synthase epsilon subunit
LVEDVGIRLVNGLHDLHLDEKLGPTQEAISKGIASGSEGVWKAYSSIKADLAKRQADFRERREKEQQKQKEQLSPDEQALKDMEEMNRQLLSTHGELRVPAAREAIWC